MKLVVFARVGISSETESRNKVMLGTFCQMSKVFCEKLRVEQKKNLRKGNIGVKIKKISESKAYPLQPMLLY